MLSVTGSARVVYLHIKAEVEGYAIENDNDGVCGNPYTQLSDLMRPMLFEKSALRVPILIEFCELIWGR